LNKPFVSQEEIENKITSGIARNLIFPFQLSFITGYAYILLTITGILLNAYVITRLVQLALNDYVSFFDSNSS
jgi:hypothetical protein